MVRGRGTPDAPLSRGQCPRVPGMDQRIKRDRGRGIIGWSVANEPIYAAALPCDGGSTTQI